MARVGNVGVDATRDGKVKITVYLGASSYYDNLTIESAKQLVERLTDCIEKDAKKNEVLAKLNAQKARIEAQIAEIEG